MIQHRTQTPSRTYLESGFQTVSGLFLDSVYIIGSSWIDSHCIQDRFKNPVPGSIPNGFCSTNGPRNLDPVLECVENPLRIDPGTFYDIEQHPDSVQNPSRTWFLDCFWTVPGLCLYNRQVQDRCSLDSGQIQEPRSWIDTQWILFYKRIQESECCSRMRRESVDNRPWVFL